MKFTLPILIILTLLLAPSVKAEECIDWPKVMSKEYLEKPTDEKIILVQPLVDESRWPGDEWLSLGLRDALSSLLEAGKNVAVMYGLKAVHNERAKHPDAIIRGTVLHTKERLKIFFNLMRF